MGSDDEIQAIRVPESDVYHLSRDGETPICNMDRGRVDYNEAQVSSVDVAEKFFRRCNTCKTTYHANIGKTTNELRGEIREAIGLDADDGTVFNAEELVKLYRYLNGQENITNAKVDNEAN